MRVSALDHYSAGLPIAGTLLCVRRPAALHLIYIAPLSPRPHHPSRPRRGPEGELDGAWNRQFLMPQCKLLLKI
jgi:hypothetical protein